jgi:hypothetical protein
MHKHRNIVNLSNMPKRKWLHQRDNLLDFYLSKAEATSNGKAKRHDCSSSQLRILSDVVGDHGLQIHNVSYYGDCFLQYTLSYIS